MSSFDDKVTAATEFLKSRAELGRTTTYQELGAVMGHHLASQGLRNTDRPVSRETLHQVLQAVDNISIEDHLVILSSLVIHLMDNGISKQFYEQAIERGILAEEADDEERESFRKTELLKVMALGSFWAAEKENRAVEVEDLADETADVL